MTVMTLRFTLSKWRSNYDGGGSVNSKGHRANNNMLGNSSVQDEVAKILVGQQSFPAVRTLYSDAGDRCQMDLVNCL